VTDEERKALASDLIRQVVDEINGLPHMVFNEEDGAPMLVVNAHGSVLHFNPQPWAEEIIKDEESKEATANSEHTRERVIIRSKKAIGGLLVTVAYVFGDALWILDKLSGAADSEVELGAFYKHVQTGVKVSTLHLIETKLRELLRLPERSHESGMEDYKASGAHLQKRDYAISDSQVLDALRQLKRFSISGLARLLAPDREDFRPTVYDWMERCRVTRDDLQKTWARFHLEV
jgi:hypothetical protein